jgi:hypothetical protein
MAPIAVAYMTIDLLVHVSAVLFVIFKLTEPREVPVRMHAPVYQLYLNAVLFRNGIRTPAGTPVDMAGHFGIADVPAQITLDFTMLDPAVAARAARLFPDAAYDRQVVCRLPKEAVGSRPSAVGSGRYARFTP